MIQLNDKGEPELVYYFEFKDGIITEFPSQSFDLETGNLNGQYVIKVMKFVPKRTDAQVKVYRWFCRLISEETGTPYEAVSRYVKCKFCPIDPETANVKQFFLPNYNNFRNIADLSIVEMSNLLDNIRIWAQDYLNIALPIPDKGYEHKKGTKTRTIK